MILQRLTNLELLQKYGGNAWRLHNFQLEATAKNLEKAVEDLKQLTVEVNRDRKNTQVRRPLSELTRSSSLYFQTQLGAQLTGLETRWTELISSVLQIEMANVALEVELDNLGKKEVELASL